MYGWRAKIGMLIPTNNTVIEPEVAFLAPEGVTYHATRMISSRTGHGCVDGLKNLVSNVDRAAEELSITGVDAMVYGCLSTSFVFNKWEEDFPTKVHKWSDVPAITAFGATCQGVIRLGAKKVAILCPYGPELQEMAVPAFNNKGLEITTLNSIGVTGLQAVCNVSKDAIYRTALNMDVEGAEALCILATDLPVLNLIPILEKDLQIPVISTNQALIWASLSLVRVAHTIENAGSLFQKQYFV